jgi:energy-coupling factor transporter ATP-binding protein EcfA2
MTDEPPSSAAERFGFQIGTVRVGDDDPLVLPGAGSVIAVVGANNAGKSTFLRQIKAVLASQSLVNSSVPRVVTQIGSPWQGSAEDMERWILQHSYQERKTDGSLVVTRGGRGFLLSDAMSVRSGDTPHFITDWFVNEQDALSRGHMCAPQERSDPAGSPPQNSMQVFHADLNKRLQLEDIARRLFGISLQFDAVSKLVGFRVGDLGVSVPLADRIDGDYVDAIARLPVLSDQGDGIRSALGLLIPLIATDFPVSLIDEPEAFLHPPQARVIGREIAALARANESQVFLATHDKNVVIGLVESGAPVTIIHLTRNVDDVATAKLLNNADIAELWKDATLRYGDALNGLFHRAVIVTEADRDSRFYHAAIDAVMENQTPKPPDHNLMFLGSNGKQNMASIVTRLRGLGVLAVSTPDLDIINSESRLQKLVEAHGGEWALLRPLWHRATSEFQGSPQPPTVKGLKKKLSALLDKIDETQLVDKNLVERIGALIKIPTTRWDEVKHYGDRAFKSDKASAAELLEKLDALGIVTVRVGELENFAEEITAPKGAEFLSVALPAKVHESESAKRHALRLLKAAGVEQSGDTPRQSSDQAP